MTTTIAVKEKPILFSAEMVRAILSGAKTQTRRISKYQQPGVANFDEVAAGDHRLRGPGEWDDEGRDYWISTFCPFGVAGRRLWVRESWQAYEPQKRRFGGTSSLAGAMMRVYANPAVEGESVIEYRADSEHGDSRKWRPSIHMPRWASRITLEISDVRVERVQDISDADARAEGYPESENVITEATREFLCENCSPLSDKPAIHWYAKLWNKINGHDSWEANPWVWVVCFKKGSP